MVDHEELIGTTKTHTHTHYLSHSTRFCLNLCRYNGVRIYFILPPMRHFIAFRNLNLENLMTTGKNNTNFTATFRNNKTGVAYVFFVIFVYKSHVMIILLTLTNCKQWPECQQCCANQSFRIDDLGD